MSGRIGLHQAFCKLGIAMQKNIDILIADIKINITYKYDFMYDFCKEYIIDNGDTCDICVGVSDEDIKKENSLVPTAKPYVCESLCIYRKIAEKLPDFNAFVFHGAAITCDKNGYMFAAPSGTGKTTHIGLWKKYLGDRVDIINGDKPIIKCDGNGCAAYGTPWSGKEGLQKNTNAPLKAICILKQSKINKIGRLDNETAVYYLMRQIFLPAKEEALGHTLSLLGKMIQNVPVYLLECDISKQAFETAYNELTNL